MMIKVCTEKRRPWCWFYNDEVKEFVRLDEHGKLKGSIKGSDLPNPRSLELERKKAKAQGKLSIGAREKPDDITYKLWEFWCANVHK